MNNKPNYEKSLAHQLGISVEEAKKRLAGTTPAGSDHRLVGEHAKRAENETTTNLADSSRVVEAKDGVKLQRLPQQWVEKAADLYLGAIESNGGGVTVELWEYQRALAAVYEQCASELGTALPGEPRTQSEVEEVEECQCSDPLIDDNDDDLGEFCHKCGLFMARGKRMERSGLHNAQAHSSTERK